LKRAVGKEFVLHVHTFKYAIQPLGKTLAGSYMTPVFRAATMFISGASKGDFCFRLGTDRIVFVEQIVFENKS